MKKISILSVCLLFSFSLVVSCKNSPQSSRAINLPFDARPFSVNNTSLNESPLRKKLLHEIYLIQKAAKTADTARIISEDLEDIKDDVNYNKNFSKLIVSFADREELYYIPEGVSKQDLLPALSLKLESGKSWIWKSNIKKGQTVYLIEASPTEVLANEKLFSTATTSSLDTIYPFQTVEISLQVLIATPAFTTQSSIAVEPSCSPGKTRCFCHYSRSVPTGGMSSYTPIGKNNVEGSIFLGEMQMPTVFRLENNRLLTNFSSDPQQMDKKSFKINLPSMEQFQFISKPDACEQIVVNKVFDLKNEFRYVMEFKIRGVSETLETFGALPVEI